VSGRAHAAKTQLDELAKLLPASGGASEQPAAREFAAELLQPLMQLRSRVERMQQGQEEGDVAAKMGELSQMMRDMGELRQRADDFGAVVVGTDAAAYTAFAQSNDTERPVLGGAQEHRTGLMCDDVAGIDLDALIRSLEANHHEG